MDSLGLFVAENLSHCPPVVLKRAGLEQLRGSLQPGWVGRRRVAARSMTVLYFTKQFIDFKLGDTKFKKKFTYFLQI